MQNTEMAALNAVVRQDRAGLRLTYAVALVEAGELTEGLQTLASIAPELMGCQPYLAARAALLRRNRQFAESLVAHDWAIALAGHAGDAAFLGKHRQEVVRLAAVDKLLPQMKKKAEHKLGPSPTGRYEGDKKETRSSPSRLHLGVRVIPFKQEHAANAACPLCAVCMAW